MSAAAAKRKAKPQPQDPVKPAEADAAVSWWRRTALWLGLLGALLLGAAHPPLKLAWLAPLAVVPWLLLVRMRELPGRRPYRAIYVAGLVHWILLLQGLRHPHWALYVGWIALSAYLACYLPLFVALCRAAVHRLGWPLLAAAPTVWVALELLRGYLLTGFSLALLGHTLADIPLLIQTADLGGAYLVSALVMCVGAAIAQAVPLADDERRRPPSESAEVDRRWRPAASLVVASLLVALAIGYGWLRLNDRDDGEQPQLTVAVLQGARDVFYEYDPKVNTEMFLAYRYYSRKAVVEHPEVGLLIWPESSVEADTPEIIIDGPLRLAPDDPRTIEQLTADVQLSIEQYRAKLHALAIDVSPRSDVDVIVSSEAWHAAGDTIRRYNSTLLVRADGKVDGRYYKMHPVLFGEYIPGGKTFPWLYDLTPMSAGLSPGKGPTAMEVGGLTLSPSICFETTVPHLIRRQVAALRREGKMPDVLINPSNDGWFHGSSILDLHARCVVFRAVEMSRPVLVAANGGLTTWVDSRGVVRERMPRKTDGYLIAQVGPGRGVTWYLRAGDWFAWLCAAATAVVIVAGVRRRPQPAGEA